MGIYIAQALPEVNIYIHIVDDCSPRFASASKRRRPSFAMRADAGIRASYARLRRNMCAQACFSFLWTTASPVTQGNAERNQFCRFGANSLRWCKIPTRTV